MILSLRRMLAGIVDWALVCSYVICVCFTVFQLDLSNGPFFAVFAFCGPLLYFGFLESSAGGGSTFGKRLFGLAVLDRDYVPIPIYKSALRTLLKVILPLAGAVAAVQMIEDRSMLSSALILMALLCLPISVCVGSGVAALDDALFGSVVVPFRKPLSTLPIFRMRHLLVTIVVAAALSFTTSALFYNGVFGTTPDPWRKLRQGATDNFGPLLTAILKDATDNDYKRFVTYVRVRPSLAPFPDKFETSPTRVYGNSIVALHGRPSLLSIDVEMTRKGYASELVREMLLQRLAVVAINFLPPPTESGEFIWANVHTAQVFGFLRLDRGIHHAIVYRRTPKGVEFAAVEPDNPGSGMFSFEAMFP